MFVIYCGFVSAIFVYAGIILSGALGGNDPANPPELQFVPFMTLVVMSAGQIAMRFISNRFIPIPDDLSSGSFILRAQTVMIVHLALLDAIAIYGICSIFFGLTSLQASLFCAVSLVFILQYIGEFKKTANSYFDLLDAERGTTA